MSRASERQAMSDTLAAYSLMSVQQVAKLLGCSEQIAKEMIDGGEIPSIPVGKRRKVDPIDAVVHLLAGREKITPAEFWELHGQAVAELVREHYGRIRVVLAGAA